MSKTSGPSVANVQSQPGTYNENQVRWGGTIVKIENRADSTLVQVVSRPLSRRARPLMNDRSDGRFIAEVAGFLDPKIYVAEREFSVVGNVSGTIEDKIGEADYQFPVVKVDSHHLWNKRVEYRPSPYPYGYPGYGYPYYGHLWIGYPFHDHSDHRRPTRITGGQSFLR